MQVQSVVAVEVEAVEERAQSLHKGCREGGKEALLDVAAKDLIGR